MENLFGTDENCEGIDEYIKDELEKDLDNLAKKTIKSRRIEELSNIYLTLTLRHGRAFRIYPSGKQGHTLDIVTIEIAKPCRGKKLLNKILKVLEKYGIPITVECVVNQSWLSYFKNSNKWVPFHNNDAFNQSFYFAESL